MMTSVGDTLLWSSYMFLANSMSTATYQQIGMFLKHDTTGAFTKTRENLLSSRITQKLNLKTKNILIDLCKVTRMTK